MQRDNLLMVADSERNADMLYAVGMFMPDPFIYLRLRGKCFMVVSDLEVDRARAQAPHCRVIALSTCLRKLARLRLASPDIADVIGLVLKERGVKKVAVPEHFPLGLALELKRRKVKLKVKPDPFFPQRAIKRADEVKKVSAALIMAEVGLAEGIHALKSAKIGRKRRLLYHNVPLTAEKLRSIIDTAILQAGGVAANTIVAGGRQSCFPHERGYGQLRAHEPIVIDVFPRSQKTGYFGDLTRTVVKGRASDAVRCLYDAVERAQAAAFGELRRKARAGEVHEKVLALFRQEGFRVGRIDGQMQGFFHGLGHGVGLEIHEAPRLGARSQDVLEAGQIVTIEPGLYYSGIGGVRLEDMALVTHGGARNLTKFEKVLEV